MKNIDTSSLVKKITVLGMSMLTSLGISSILPILPSLAIAFNIPIKDCSIIIAAFALPGFFLMPLYGFIADTFGRKYLLIPSLVLFILGGLGSFFSNSLSSLVFFRVIHGIGAGSLTLLYTTIIADTWQGKEKTKMMGLSGMALGIGTGISPVLGGFIGTFGWRWSFLLTLLALPLLFTSATLPLYTPSKKPRRHIKTEIFSYYTNLYRTFFLKGSLPLLFLTFCSFLLLSGPIIICYPLIATNVFHASPLAIGTIMSLASLASALPASALSFLHTKFSAKQLLLSAQASYTFFILLLAFFAEEHHGFSFSTLLLPLLFYGIAQGVTVPLIASLLSGQTSEQYRASLMALNSMSMRLAQAFGAVFFSAIIMYKGIFTASLLGIFPIALMVIILIRYRLPEQ